jgi:hypothetical protein
MDNYPTEGHSGPPAVLLRFDELNEQDSRLLSFNREPETGNPEPIPQSSLAASGDSGRMGGDKFH